jgi:hypothetical protein
MDDATLFGHKEIITILEEFGGHTKVDPANRPAAGINAAAAAS